MQRIRLKPFWMVCSLLQGNANRGTAQAYLLSVHYNCCLKLRSKILHHRHPLIPKYIRLLNTKRTCLRLPSTFENLRDKKKYQTSKKCLLLRYCCHPKFLSLLIFIHPKFREKPPKSSCIK